MKAQLAKSLGWATVGVLVVFKIAVLVSFAFEQITGRLPAIGFVAGAQAKPLDGQSTGSDWRSATKEERVQWAVTVGKLVETEKIMAAALAVGVMRCLDEAVTARTDEEDLAVQVVKDQKLAFITAFCVAGMRSDK